MSIINESIQLHSAYFDRMIEDDAEVATKAEYTPQNNDVVN